MKTRTPQQLVDEGYHNTSYHSAEHYEIWVKDDKSLLYDRRNNRVVSIEHIKIPE